MTVDKAAILNGGDLGVEKIDIPEWPGGPLFVKVMTTREIVQIEDAIPESASNDLKLAITACMCLVDEAGRKIFDRDDAEALANTRGSALLRVTRAYNRINGIGDGDDYAKNSETAQH